MSCAVTAETGRRLLRNKTFTLQRRADDRQNSLLACLPDDDFDSLRSHFTRVELLSGNVLYDSGVSPLHIHFPITATVSLTFGSKAGAMVEMASVGRDGLVGTEIFMGGDSTSSSATVSRAGTLIRLPARELRMAFARGGPLQHLFLRYTQALLSQMAQRAACNRHHSVHQQFCRWLLTNADMAPGADLLHSQESIARALGVRREGVSAEAVQLRERRVISYHRGCITLLDRAKLEDETCECYGTMRREYQRLLPREVAT